MNLSTLYNNNTLEYIEFAEVCAPNKAGYTAPIGISVLKIDTEVQDTGNLVTAPNASNQFTLPAGTYYFEAYVGFRRGDSNWAAIQLGLRAVGSANWISRGAVSYASNSPATSRITGQFKITTSTSFELTALVRTELAGSIPTIDNGIAGLAQNDATANAEQRTTIKLWKVK